MLHTKFQSNWPSSSGEEDFLRFWAFLSMAAILVMWLWPFDNHYFFIYPILDSYEMYYHLALLYFLEKMLKMF